jgi:DNA-binding CsgD family transcriptional regulator
MLQGSYLSVLEARTHGEFRDEIVRFTQSLGFETVSAMLVIDHTLGESEFINIDNTPPGYREAFKNTERGKLDPVMQHCRTHSVPIIWGQDTYVKAGRARLWEEQAHFGYCAGIAMALHLPNGQHFFMGVDRDQALPSDRSELTRVVADLQLFAVHAQDAALRVLMPMPVKTDAPALTPRELEALRWTMEGKTAWEVGAILGISERTAVLHVNNAMHKLDCVNKHQAVLKALRLGLIR